MQCRLTYFAFAVHRCPTLLFCQQLVLVKFSASAFSGIASAGFPFVGHDNLAELIFTFATDHYAVPPFASRGQARGVSE